MKLIFVLAGLFAASLAAPNEKCVVEEWGDWTPCKGRTGQCAGTPHKSYPMSDAQKSLGKGRKAMEHTMELKRQIAIERQRCIANNTCPHLLPKPSQRFTQCDGGFAGEYPCSNINLMAFLSFEDLGFSGATVGGNDMWVWHDEAFGQDYALMGTTHGTSFVRITDPLNPEVLATLPTHTTPSSWRDMKVVNNHAYIVSEAGSHGLQVFDLTRLRVMTGQPGPLVPEVDVDAHLDNFGQAHNIAANVAANRLYVIGSRYGSGDGVCAGGLHVIDVSDPKNPVTLGCNAIDGYVHDTECFFYDGPDPRYTGRDICYGYNEDSLTIYDADQLQYISRETYTGSQYTHQGWATESRRFLLLDDELDEVYGGDPYTKTYLWNIEDLENPVLVNTYRSAETSIDHNLYIVGDLAYQTNYEAGLRVLRINEINPGLEEIAYFDVFPSRTQPDFYGSWSNYPWLPNNVVAVSSIDYGLYLLQLDVASIEAEQQSAVPFGEQHRYRKAVFGTDFDTCPPLVERRTCVPETC